MDERRLFRSIIVNGCLLGYCLSAEASLSEVYGSFITRLNEENLTEYLDKGGDINVRVLEFPLLSSSIHYGYPNFVKLLLKRKADPDVVDANGDTPLGHAVRKCNFGIVELLLNYNADPNKISGLDTPLVHAVRSCCWRKSKDKLKKASAIVKLLLRSGADPNPHFSQVSMLPLHAAAYYGVPQKVIERLIDAGADVEGRDCYGNTPLHVAAKNGGYLQIWALIGKGANVNALNEFNQTPFDSAISGRNKIRREINEEKDLRDSPIKGDIDFRYKVTTELLRLRGATIGSDVEPEDSEVQ
ncbi:MAG: ankyrin repeat domain-containing protein [Puniceicoccales bacterium]|jgi:ankyrin repeat protein|nr:ankyrin repeat domain-containing protein [Puniceicoccales bacterium]